MPDIDVKKGPVDTNHSPYARLRTLPLGAARLNGGFWGSKQDVNREATLEHGYQMLEKAGNLHNLRVAAGREAGEYRGRNFLDSDVYKWIEGVAYELAKNPQSPLKAKVDAVIDLIADAQEADGYLNSYVQIVAPETRFVDMDHGHELYCAGHLIQAAVAHHRATGDTRLLTVATRFADLADSIFGVGKRIATEGHPGIEMALVELYRETGERRYLDLSQFLLDVRGRGTMRGLGWYGPEYHQDRVPVREAQIIEGHAVRAVYLMAGVADIALETGEQALIDASLRLWDDMTTGKLYITGGVGARYEGESFGDPYELPNDQCYCETCAAIGSLMWNWRMLLLTGERRFADLMEQTLYNGIMSGIATDGAHFFYINPLLSRLGAARAEWYEVACCPPNIMRTLASIEHYLATTDEQGVQIHLYAPASLDVQFGAGRGARIDMQTAYPWDGLIRLSIESSDGAPWVLRLRVPAWCAEARLRVNGEEFVSGVGDLVVERAWQMGDVVELALEMPAVLVESHPSVEANRDSVAIVRGPVVYCLEQGDQPEDVDLLRIAIDTHAPLRVETNDTFDGAPTIEAVGYRRDVRGWSHQLYQRMSAAGMSQDVRVVLRAVPYYAWANRGAGAMRVWIPRYRA
jgi:hypothetical protein